MWRDVCASTAESTSSSSNIDALEYTARARETGKSGKGQTNAYRPVCGRGLTSGLLATTQVDPLVERGISTRPITGNVDHTFSPISVWSPSSKMARSDTRPTAPKVASYRACRNLVEANEHMISGGNGKEPTEGQNRCWTESIDLDVSSRHLTAKYENMYRSVLEPRGLGDKGSPVRLNPVLLGEEIVPLQVGERDGVWRRARTNDLTGEHVGFSKESC